MIEVAELQRMIESLKKDLDNLKDRRDKSAHACENLATIIRDAEDELAKLREANQ